MQASDIFQSTAARLALTSMVAVFQFGCGPVSTTTDDETGDPALVAAALKHCGIYGSGNVTQVQGTPLEWYDACTLQCLTDADCDELSALVCNYETVDGLAQCKLDCLLVDSFECPSGAVVIQASVCDGFDDCVGGEDEEHCPRPISSCRVDSYSICDGHDDCEDGSDESGCNYLKCDNGDIVPASEVCSGWEYCDDGRDERGCAELTCEDF